MGDSLGVKDGLGMTYNPPTPMKMLTEGGSLSRLSLELRETIYEYYFSQERKETSPDSVRMGGSRSTLLLKLPLLRTSKSIRADALPSFYKCHIFRIQHPTYNRISHFMTSGIQPMRRVELLTPCDDVEVAGYEPKVTPYLEGFLDLFPELRLLILHFFDKTSPPYGSVDETSEDETFHPLTLRLLRQLLERLDRLEMVLYHERRDTQISLDSLEVLAPRSRWIEESSGVVKGRKHRDMRTVWSLSCSTASKDRKNQASGPRDGSELP